MKTKTLKEKSTIIIFEGADRVGKDTFAKMFNEYTKYKYLIFVRAFYSNHLYDKKFNRHLDRPSNYWQRELRKLVSKFNVVVVLVSATNLQLGQLTPEYVKDQLIFDSNFSKFMSESGVEHFIRIQNPGDKRIELKIGYLNRLLKKWHVN